MNPQAKCSVRRLWFLFLLVLAFPAAYVLSIGPAVFIWRTFDISDTSPIGYSIATLYRPIGLIPEKKPFKKAVRFYIRLWLPRDDTAK